MIGETDLATLLRTMDAALADGEFVFCTVADPQGIENIGTFREDEGWTVIVARSVADARGLRYDGVFRLITLRVHSSLLAVGFLAAMATALAREGISVNAISAFHHDHLFVPADRAEDAMRVLRTM